MNYYEILEVSVNASKEVIKNAYRALTKKYHPDSYKGNQEYAQEKMKEINEAYETLMDDNKRLMYDYENGFKIDPNAPKNEIELKEEDIKVEEKENKEDKLMTFIKEKKVFIVVGVIILFIIAFIIGIMIAGGGDSDKKDTEDEIVVNNEDTKVEDENTTNNTNTYRPNNNINEEPKEEEEYTKPVNPSVEDNINNNVKDEDDEIIKEPDGIS